MRRLLLVSLVLAAAGLAGCSSTRPPAESIRDTADHEYSVGDYAAAAEGYREIVDRYPGDWRAQYKLGLCHLELDQPTEARRALEIAITRRPDKVDVADALAESMYLQGDETALYAFLQERAEGTQSVHAYLRLAKYCVQLGDPDSAKTAIDTAVVLDDGRTVEPYLAAAAFAERVGDLDEALRRLRQAYAIDPKDEQVLARLRALGEVPGPTLALPPGR